MLYNAGLNSLGLGSPKTSLLAPYVGSGQLMLGCRGADADLRWSGSKPRLNF